MRHSCLLFGSSTKKKDLKEDKSGDANMQPKEQLSSMIFHAV